VPKISLQVYRTRIRNQREKKLKQKRGKFNDSFSEGLKRQFAGHVQEVNRFLMSLPKYFLLKLAEYMGIYPNIEC